MEAMAAAKPLLSGPPLRAGPSLVSARSCPELPFTLSRKLGAGGPRHPARLSLSALESRPPRPSRRPGDLAAQCSTDVAEAAETVPIEKRFPEFPTVLDINQIRGILPHRFPFLLVDRVIEYEPGVMAVAIKNVTINDNFFPGHFPERPIMPGVLMVEFLKESFVKMVKNILTISDNYYIEDLGLMMLIVPLLEFYKFSKESLVKMVKNILMIIPRQRILVNDVIYTHVGIYHAICEAHKAMAQVGGIVMLQPEVGGSSTNFFFAGIDKVRFRKPVIAGDTLVMRMTLTKLQRRFGIAKMEGKAYVGGGLVCEGEFLMATGGE